VEAFRRVLDDEKFKGKAGAFSLKDKWPWIATGKLSARTTCGRKLLLTLVNIQEALASVGGTMADIVSLTRSVHGRRRHP
jgi:hypothetical protein